MGKETQEKTIEPNAFEKELTDLLNKHGVTRFVGAFNDPDRNPYLIDRVVALKSGQQWACNAMLQLAQKIKRFVEEGRLRPEDDLPPPSEEMKKQLGAL